MKLTDFPKTDQAIIKAMKAHIGIDKAIKLNTLAQSLNSQSEAYSIELKLYKVWGVPLVQLITAILSQLMKLNVLQVLRRKNRQASLFKKQSQVTEWRV